MNPTDRNAITRRKLLALLGGGTAAGFTLGSQTWFRSAFASTEPPGPTIPAPTLPPEDLGPPASVPTVADLAASLDWDPEKMFRFVADEVRYDPYAGALRGATGTLWGRAGNSVDQALLLAALLDEGAVPYRFAFAALDDAAVGELATSAAIDAERARTHAASVLLQPEIADAWTGDGAWRRAPEIDQLLTEVRAQIGDSVRVIEDAFAAAGVTLPSGIGEATVPDRERTAHMWLQYADGPDWIDLDPTRPDSAAVEATTTVGSYDDLPDDLFHTVTFRISADVVSGGVPTRTELLSHTVRSAEVSGTGVLIVHPTAEWLGVAAAITGAQQFVPTLIVGDAFYEGTTMSLSAGGGVLGAFGDETEAEGQSLAEWLEIDVAVPDQPVQTSARTIFDRIDPADRAAGTIDVTTLPPIELVDVGDGLGDVYVPLSGLLTVAVAAHQLPPTYFPQDVIEPGDLALIDSVTHGYFYMRDIVRLDMLGELGADFYADEPNVVAFASTPDGDNEYAIAVDILHAHHVARPLTGDTATNPLLAAGALDHAAERLILEGAPKLLADAPQTSITGVGRVFELANEQGIEIVVLQPGDSIDSVELPPGAAGLVAAALEGGRVVVIPRAPVSLDGASRTGWWEVDLQSGRTADRLDNGGGTDLIEFIVIVKHRVEQAACIAAVGAAIAMVAGAAAGYVTNPAEKVVLLLPFGVSACAGGALHGH